MGNGTLGRILILLPGLSDDCLAGPEIRGWEMALALSKTFQVSVAADVPYETRREGIRLIPRRRSRLLQEILHHDVILAAWLPPFLLTAARIAGRSTVADLYDPVEFELLGDQRGIERVRRSVRELTAFQVRFADAVTCGSGTQMERLREAVASSDRTDSAPLLACVPFGVPAPPVDAHGPGRLRELFGSIGPDDIVALWWGSVWHWLDAETPVRAMKQLSEIEPRLKLVLSVGAPADPVAQRLTRTDEMRELAQELGLLDDTVFFLEHWIPYSNRSEILTDADIGITFHSDPAEAAMAVRARYLDFVWCSLPMVLTPGDELGNELIHRGAAISASSGNVDSAAEALLKLVRHPDLRRSAAKAAGAVARERPWSTVIEPMTDVMKQVIAGKGKRAGRRHQGLVRAVLRYYVLRMWDKLLTPLPRKKRGALS